MCPYAARAKCVPVWLALQRRCAGAFNEDVTSKDPERKGITLKNLGHYYTLSRVVFLLVDGVAR